MIGLNINLAVLIEASHAVATLLREQDLVFVTGNEARARADQLTCMKRPLCNALLSQLRAPGR